MHAVILAGGKGTRLKPFTLAIPKPLVPIGEIPIIELLIRQLQAHGFDRITISVGHMAALIRTFCGDGSQWGIPIDYAVEDEPLGTVGGLGIIEGFDDDRVLVVNGDTLTDLDFASVYQLHDPADAATICANRRAVDIEFGVLETDDSGYLASYREKPRLSYLVSMGCNILSVDAIERHLKPRRQIDMPELLAQLEDAGEGVKVVAPDAFWLDLGRLDDLEEGSRLFSERPERFLKP